MNESPQRLKESLPLMEEFYTIQGEGHHQGKAAYFVRLGGCDVGCHWCDVKESWDLEKHPMIGVQQIVNNVVDSGAPIAVITGGEPLMHDLTLLTSSLRKVGIRTNLETSGAYPLTGQWDWICLSPKKFKPALPLFYEMSDELKVIIFNRSDFKWAEEHALRVNKNCNLFLQPEWTNADIVTPMIIEYVKFHPQWRISLQTHKYMDIP